MEFEFVCFVGLLQAADSLGWMSFSWTGIISICRGAGNQIWRSLWLLLASFWIFLFFKKIEKSIVVLCSQPVWQVSRKLSVSDWLIFLIFFFFSRKFTDDISLIQFGFLLNEMLWMKLYIHEFIYRSGAIAVPATLTHARDGFTFLFHSEGRRRAEASQLETRH